MNGVGIEKSDIATCCGGTFLMLKLSVESFAEKSYHIEFKYQVDSIVVAIDYVPVLFFPNFCIEAFIPGWSCNRKCSI